METGKTTNSKTRIVLQKWNLFLDFLKTEKGLSILAVLPLFFTWLPVYHFQGEKENVRKACLYSLLFTGYFLLAVLVCDVLEKIPLAGAYISNGLHLLSILVYLSACFYSIYCALANKTLELGPLQKQYAFISSWIESAHSSTG
jgi:Ni,Fe-hydrogenase I cytochrome b subunit